MKQFFFGVAITLGLFAVIAAAFYVGNRSQTPQASPLAQSPLPPTSKAPSSSPSPLLPVSPSPSPTPSIAVSSQIEAAIKSKNTAALEGYMQNPVQVRLEASECCGPLTPQQAVTQLDYLNAATNWDFSPQNPVIQKLNTQVPQFYGSSHIVGVSANKYVVGFKLSAQNQIEAISMAASYDLLIAP